MSDKITTEEGLVHIDLKRLSPDRLQLLEKIRRIRSSIGSVSTNSGDILRILSEDGD